jgi:eukaryotic-like serine/threonine-protein kinase
LQPACIARTLDFMNDTVKPDPLLGRRLGPEGFLVIQERLGTGGMGAVYRALDEQHHRQVAIKFLHPEFLFDPDRLARFQREGKKFAALSHPNLVAVHGLGREERRFFIVSDYVAGKTLEQLLEEEGAIPVGEALWICREIALGLAAAHAHRIIHRDLKPANVMLRSTDRRVMVLDFGIAKDLDATTQLTVPGLFLGTPGYSAPEQIQGADIDHRADIFSLGVILHELLTGQLIAHDRNNKNHPEIRFAAPKPEPVPAPRFNEEIIDPLARVIKRMLQKKPRRRPRDMREVIGALEDIISRLKSGYTQEATHRVKDPLLRALRH